MGQLVIARDDDWGLIHRPKLDSAVDWAIRLVRGALLGKPPDSGIKKPKFLFDETTMSRMATELNYAFEHEIKSELVTAFIDELGGHEIIAAKLAVGEYDFRNEKWLQSYRHYLEFSHHPRSILPGVAHDDDDDCGDHTIGDCSDQGESVDEDGWPI